MRTTIFSTLIFTLLFSGVCLAAIECGYTNAQTDTEWQVFYDGRTYINGITTFSYRIVTETNRDSPLCRFGNNCQNLSHWDLLLPCEDCPYTSSPVSTCGQDGSTTINGERFVTIKWEAIGSSTEEVLTYTLSFEGNIPEGPVTYIVKGSTRCGTATITGPAISSENCGEAPECVDDEDCDDNIACTNNVCNDGECTYPVNNDSCADEFSCTTEACDPTADNADANGCSITLNDNLCADGFSCTTEVCDPAADNADEDGCVITADDDLCDDQVDCTDDKCEPTNSSRIDGCTFTENDENCEDGNICTDDECSSTDDCQFPPNTVPCDDLDECTGTTAQPDRCGNSSCQPGGDVCPPFEETIWAGQHFNAGEVVITNDGSKLYFIWTASTGWVSKEFHIYVGLTPPAKSSPGKFPYNFNLAQNVASAQFTIPYPAGVACGSTVYVAFHAVVTNVGAPCLSTNTCPGSQETAWMDGHDAPPGWHQWGNYNHFTVCCCAGFSHVPDLLGNSAVSLTFTTISRKATGASPTLTADAFAQYLSELLDYPVSRIYVFSFEGTADGYQAVVGFADYQGISGSTMVKVLEQTPPEAFDQFGIGNVEITVKKMLWH